jgi:phosphoribosylanthranilate isomerase
MIVKVCGITNRADAEAAVACGANALGFNFYPRSTRYIGIGDAAKIVAGLPPGILKVGVFVNEPAARVAELMRRIKLQVAQLHGDETPEQYPAGERVWKAARVDDQFTWEAWAADPAEALLLDSAPKGSYGGSGQTFDWQRVAAPRRQIILAGGLDGTNVAEAIRLVSPWGVDSCSRIERAPGRKDHEKMAAFVRAALEASDAMEARA